MILFSVYLQFTFQCCGCNVIPKMYDRSKECFIVTITSWAAKSSRWCREREKLFNPRNEAWPLNINNTGRYIPNMSFLDLATSCSRRDLGRSKFAGCACITICVSFHTICPSARRLQASPNLRVRLEVLSPGFTCSLLTPLHERFPATKRES